MSKIIPGELYQIKRRGSWIGLRICYFASKDHVGPRKQWDIAEIALGHDDRIFARHNDLILCIRTVELRNDFSLSLFMHVNTGYQFLMGDADSVLLKLM